MTRRDAGWWKSLLLASLACACSLTHDRDDRNEPVAGSAAEGGGSGAGGAHAGTQAPLPSAGSAGSAGSSGNGGSAGADMEPPPQDDPGIGSFPLPPVLPEVADRFKALQEPDFAQAPEMVAETHCGSILRIDELTEVGEALAGAQAEVTRVFDAEGRLLVAEESATITGHPHLILEGIEGTDRATRLQLDHDAEGRVRRVRQGALDELRDEHGTVVDFTYAADGSYRADIATTYVYPGTDGISDLSPRGFCEQMEFDAAGRLLRTSWGCEASEQARAFSYDAQGRPLEVTGRPIASFTPITLVDPRFGESSEWRIRYDYAVPGEVSVVWNEVDLRGEMPLELEQRLVRRFDTAGRLVSTEFDHGNDGSVDERADCTYEDPESEAFSRQAYDFGLDGVIDLVEERSRQGDTQAIERRHMAQWGDENRFHYSIGHFYAQLSTGRHSSSPQSLSRWTVQLDADDRIVSAGLEMRLVPAPLTTSSAPQEFAASLVQRFAAAGHVEHVAVESTGLAYVAIGEQAEVLSRRETTCSLQSACAGDAPVLPDDPALAACQTDTGAASRVLLPHMQSPYLPPPFDRIEAMRTRHAHAASFDPRPPTVREIVGY
jgi:YD repeat-containing protein